MQVDFMVELCSNYFYLYTDFKKYEKTQNCLFLFGVSYASQMT